MPGDAVDDVRSIVLENKGEGGFGIPDNDIEVAPFVIFFLINRTRDVAFLSSQGGDTVRCKIFCSRVFRKKSRKAPFRRH